MPPTPSPSTQDHPPWPRSHCECGTTGTLPLVEKQAPFMASKYIHADPHLESAPLANRSAASGA